MVNARLKYVVADIDRHGNVRYYFRKRGVNKIRLPGKPGEAAFMAAYQAARDGRPIIQASEALSLQRSPGTLEWLCNSYFRSIEFDRLSKYTRRDRRNIFNATCAEPLSPSDGTRLGDLPFAMMTEASIRMLRNRKKATPAAANNWLSAMNVLFKWAIEEQLAEHNPARDVPKINAKTEGYHTWTADELQRYESAHAVGTQARLAIALLAFTGLRRSDVVRIGPQHIGHDSVLRVKPQKTLSKTAMLIEIPVLPELAEAIAATRCGHLTFLLNEWQKPWTPSGFSKAFKAWCVEAGMPHCSAHGVRKAGACTAAENGATAAQMMAIFGWSTAAMATKYTRAADRKKIAGASIHLLAKRQNKD